VTTRKSLNILFSGMIAGDPRQGGATWAVLQYVLGLRRLGHEVLFVEPITADRIEASSTYLREVAASFNLGGRLVLLEQRMGETFGASYDDVKEFARRCNVLINVSGMLTDESLISIIPRRVYLDLDPAFVQMWHAYQGIDMRFDAHTDFVTVGLNVGKSGCDVPTCAREWVATLQPVVLEHWQMADRPPEHRALTTVANWRGYGSIEHADVHYGQKAHSFRKIIDLPTRTTIPCMPAISIHPDEMKDVAALASHRWHVLDPAHVAGTPAAYRNFVRGSWGEIGVAKSGYVASRCGWFSDRSACYLASGRPVVAQRTGWENSLPIGEGLLPFATTDEAASAVESIERDYLKHSRAARAIAEERFDSDKVLPRLLELAGAE
jgi:hypothetical protein